MVYTRAWLSECGQGLSTDIVDHELLFSWSHCHSLARGLVKIQHKIQLKINWLLAT